MITSISNNIGISQVSFKAYQSANLTVLNARIALDVTAAAYLAADVIEFKFSSLVMKKSNVSAVFLMAFKEDPHRGTILRSWIKNNSLFIEKTDHFDEKGPLYLYVCTAYVTGGQHGTLVRDGGVTVTFSNKPNGVKPDYKQCIVKENYIYLLLKFNGLKSDDESLDVEFDINCIPEDVDIYFPLVYPDNSIHQKGAPMAQAHLAGTHFSITNSSGWGLTTNEGQFLQIFIAREPSESE